MSLRTFSAKIFEDRESKVVIYDEALGAIENTKQESYDEGYRAGKEVGWTAGVMKGYEDDYGGRPAPHHLIAEYDRGRTDERERIVRELGSIAPYANIGMAIDMINAKSRPPQDPKPLRKLPQIAGPEYTYEATVRTFFNELVDAVQDLQRKVKP